MGGREAVVAIGSARAAPGEIAYGALPVLELPTGGWESLPIIIARGKDGATDPTLWLTANIHGAELTGIAVLHRVMTAALPEELRGTVIAIPSLNPAGLRTGARTPYYGADDPNRLWPTARRNPPATPGPYERVALRVHEEFRRRGNFLLDLHNASLRSVPFTIADRVLYETHDAGGRPRAERLVEVVLEMARAFGLPIVHEMAPVTYLRQELHRSVSGSAVNALGMPALTIELGLTGALDPVVVEAGVNGVRNVLRWAGMLPDDLPDQPPPAPIADFATRRDDSPHIPVSGLLTPLVQPGMRFTAGEPLARIVDVWGRELPGGELVAPADGWLIGWRDGMARYAGQRAVSLAVRDEFPLVAPFSSS